MDTPDLNPYYQLLELSPDATSDEIQQAYLQKVAARRREGKKSEIEPLKIAYQTLWDYTLQQSYQEAQENPQDHLNEVINQGLRPHHIQAKAYLKEDSLCLIFDAGKIRQSQVNPALIRSILAEIPLPDLTTIKVMGKREGKTIFWKYQFLLSSQAVISETDKLLQRAEENARIWGFPIAIVISLLLNVTGLNWFWNMWIHEFGHATIAWLAGYRALPTFAVTIMSEEKSLFVYFGILFLLGLLFWSGKKENQRWTMGLAVFLILLQFHLTWVTTRDTYEMLQAFGGVGAEFYLSTLLMIGFYFPLPQRLHWDFWRYFVLVIASSTFLANFVRWQKISKGQDFIPWGTFWGGEGDGGGDMNTLSDWYAWSNHQIIDTYRFFGHLCLGLLVGVYVYYLFKSSAQLRRYFRR